MILVVDLTLDDGCYVCGSTDLYDYVTDYATGVVAPDGGAERRQAVITRCRACGAEEERR
jgi:hypothetical protein